jgi:hypothetical protein
MKTKRSWFNQAAIAAGVHCLEAKGLTLSNVLNLFILLKELRHLEAKKNPTISRIFFNLNFRGITEVVFAFEAEFLFDNLLLHICQLSSSTFYV